MKLRGVAVACGLLLVSACSSGTSQPAAGSAEFGGLDKAVVSEVLHNPVAMKKISEEPVATRASMAQGIVVNFEVCRDAYRVFDAWTTTGQAPALAPLPTPTSPQEPSYTDWKVSYGLLRNRIASGEIDQLRDWLTLSGSCGTWIPAKPGDANGPTIRDAVQGAA